MLVCYYLIKLIAFCWRWVMVSQKYHLQSIKYWFYRWRWVGRMNQVKITLFCGREEYHISPSSDRKSSAGCWRIANSYETKWMWWFLFFDGCYYIRRWIRHWHSRCEEKWQQIPIKKFYTMRRPMIFKFWTTMIIIKWVVK